MFCKNNLAALSQKFKFLTAHSVRIKRKAKQSVSLALIMIMVLPHVVLAANLYDEYSPWLQLAEIAPIDFYEGDFLPAKTTPTRDCRIYCSKWITLIISQQKSKQ